MKLALFASVAPHRPASLKCLSKMMLDLRSRCDNSRFFAIAVSARTSIWIEFLGCNDGSRQRTAYGCDGRNCTSGSTVPRLLSFRDQMLASFLSASKLVVRTLTVMWNNRLCNSSLAFLPPIDYDFLQKTNTTSLHIKGWRALMIGTTEDADQSSFCANLWAGCVAGDEYYICDT